MSDNENKKYTVVEEFELGGTVQAVDSVVELTDEQAEEFASKVKVVEADAAPGAEGGEKTDEA